MRAAADAAFSTVFPLHQRIAVVVVVRFFFFLPALLGLSADGLSRAESKSAANSLLAVWAVCGCVCASPCCGWRKSREGSKRSKMTPASCEKGGFQDKDGFDTSP